MCYICAWKTTVKNAHERDPTRLYETNRHSQMTENKTWISKDPPRSVQVDTGNPLCCHCSKVLWFYRACACTPWKMLTELVYFVFSLPSLTLEGLQQHTTVYETIYLVHTCNSMRILVCATACTNKTCCPVAAIHAYTLLNAHSMSCKLYGFNRLSFFFHPLPQL